MAEKLTLTLHRDEVERLVTLVRANTRPVVTWVMLDAVLLSKLKQALAAAAAETA